MTTTSDDEILFRIESLIQKCDECDIWEGSMCRRYNRPRLSVRVGGKQHVLNIQRYIWNNDRDALASSDIIKTSCENEKCVNINHFIIEKRKNEPGYTTPDDKVLEHIENNVTFQGDCKLWNLGSIGTFNRPIAKKYVDGDQRDIDVQRFIWNLTHDKITRCNILKTSCGHTNCVSANHLVILPKAEPPNWDKIWARMLKKTEENEDGCFIWTASKIGKYGQSTIHGKTMSAHRASYLVKTKGVEIPTEVDGLPTHIRHTCGNDLCVNPDHLELGNAVHNAEDKVRHGTNIRGAQSKLAKITEETASKIKLSKFEKGDPRYETKEKRAIRFGTTKCTVSSIDWGKTWTHIPDRDGNIGSSKEFNAKKRKRTMEIQSKVWNDDDYEKAGKILYTMITKSETSKKFDVDGECWDFTGYVPDQYGSVSIMGKRKGAHVMSCEIKEKRSIAKGEHTVHLCGNPECIAPHHLCFNTPRFNSLTSIKNGSRVAKLDEDKVRKIRDLSLSKKDLAVEFGVSEDTIRNVRDGRTWTHIV